MVATDNPVRVAEMTIHTLYHHVLVHFVQGWPQTDLFFHKCTDVVQQNVRVLGVCSCQHFEGKN